jgi:hypothetical protein
MAQNAANQINATITAAMAMRSGAESRSNDGKIVGDGWAVPLW